jgi:DNA-binding response OmpR family regulator
MRSVLVVEDDGAIRRGLVDALRFAGYVVSEAADGDEGEARALRGSFDLVLLDLVLPGRDGREVLSAIRAARPTQPVILLTAIGGEDDRIAGLAAGADDYVTKPFSVRELLARVEAVLRRSAERPVDVREIAFSGGIADLERREVRFVEGARAELAEKDVELLRYLAANRGRAVPREEILVRVWRLDPGDASGRRSVDMQVMRLREKLRDSAAEPRVVLTVRGKGYMLAAAP